MDEDVGVFEDRFHGRGVGHEVRGEEALVELHAFDELDAGIEALAFLDGDDAVLADLVHGVGDHLADLGVLVGGAGADLGDLLGRVDLLAHAGELIDDCVDGGLDATLDLGGVGAGGDVLEAFGVDGLGVDGGGGGSIAGDGAGLGGDFLDHLSAHVFVGVFEFDFLGDGDAVLGDGGCAEGLFENDVSA